MNTRRSPQEAADQAKLASLDALASMGASEAEATSVPNIAAFFRTLLREVPDTTLGVEFSTDGAQAWLVLSQPMDVAQAKALQLALAVEGALDDATEGL